KMPAISTTPSSACPSTWARRNVAAPGGACWWPLPTLAIMCAPATRSIATHWSAAPVFTSPARYTYVAGSIVQRHLFLEPAGGPAGAGVRYGDRGQWAEGRANHSVSVLQRGHSFACALHLHPSMGSL